MAKSKKDRSHYKVEGTICTTKSAVAHTIIERFVRKYDYKKINEMFKESKAYNESMPLLATINEAKRRSKKHTRYLLHGDDILTDKNGTKVALSNSFSNWNLPSFLKFSKRKFKISVRKVK